MLLDCGKGKVFIYLLYSVYPPLGLTALVNPFSTLLFCLFSQTISLYLAVLSLSFSLN